MYCPNCGKKILQSNKFCPYCGFKINKNINITRHKPVYQSAHINNVKCTKSNQHNIVHMSIINIILAILCIVSFTFYANYGSYDYLYFIFCEVCSLGFIFVTLIKRHLIKRQKHGISDISSNMKKLFFYSYITNIIISLVLLIIVMNSYSD